MTNKYTSILPFTKEQLERDYVNAGMSQAEIALKYKATQKVVWSAMKRWGIPTRKAFKRNQTGAANSYWKGENGNTGHSTRGSRP